MQLTPLYPTLIAVAIPTFVLFRQSFALLTLHISYLDWLSTNHQQYSSSITVELSLVCHTARCSARTVDDTAQHLPIMSGPPAQALATHLINQTLSSLSVLETLNIISRDDASQIRSKLPNPYGPFPSLGSASSPSATASFSQLSMGPASPPPHQPSPQPPMPPMHNQMAVVPSLPPRAPQSEVRARALWDYSGTVSRMRSRKADR